MNSQNCWKTSKMKRLFWKKNRKDTKKWRHQWNSRICGRIWPQNVENDTIPLADDSSSFVNDSIETCGSHPLNFLFFYTFLHYWMLCVFKKRNIRKHPQLKTQSFNWKQNTRKEIRSARPRFFKKGKRKVNTSCWC